MKFLQNAALVICFATILFCLNACDKSKTNNDPAASAKAQAAKQETSKNSVSEDKATVAYKALIDNGQQLKPGLFAVFPMWETLTPTRKQGCSVKQGTEVEVMEEVQHKGVRFCKIKTPKCTGYITCKYVKPLN